MTGLGTAEAPPIRDLGLSAWLPVAGMLLPMDAYGSVLEQLSRDECLRLMGSVPVGRIVYTRQALPAVELVNFTLDDGDIIIRTDAGGKLAAATRGAVVAFEADSLDVTGHAGWSVTVVGHVHGGDRPRRRSAAWSSSRSPRGRRESATTARSGRHALGRAYPRSLGRRHRSARPPGRP